VALPRCTLDMALPKRPLGMKLLASARPKISLEFYMDPFCPFCSKIWQVIDHELVPWCTKALPDAVSLVIHLLPQPWHPQSGILCEGAFAVKEQSEAAAWEYLRGVWDPSTRAAWSDEATYSMSRAQIYDAIAEKIVSKLEGVDVTAWRSRLTPLPTGGVGVTAELKACVKHGRLLSIHVSPTCVTNGVRDDSVSSSWGLAEWQAYLERVLGEPIADSAAASSSA
jgi:hypothetical protein